PRRGRHHPPRDGNIVLAEDDSVPEGQAKSALAPIRRPPSRAEGHCTGARLKRFFLLDRPRPVLFLSRTKGAPAAPCAVGKGGARERAQFSPQAETELSGLCDDAMGGRICPAILMAESPGGRLPPYIFTGGTRKPGGRTHRSAPTSSPEE